MLPDMLEIHGNILLDVTKQLQLKFNPLFEKPRRPKSNFPLLEAFSTVTCTILQTTTTTTKKNRCRCRHNIIKILS